MNILKTWNVSGVYSIRNLIDGNEYVGSTVNVYNKLQKHRYLLRRGRHPNGRLQTGWKQYKEEDFCALLLEQTSDLLQREQYWYNVLKAKYNIITDIINHIPIQESKDKQSLTRKELFATGALIANCSKQISLYDYEGKLLESYQSKNKLSMGQNIPMTTVNRMIAKPYYVTERYPYMIRWGSESKIGSFWNNAEHYLFHEIGKIPIRVAHLFHLHTLYHFPIKTIQHLRSIVGKTSLHGNKKFLLDLVKPGELLESPMG